MTREFSMNELLYDNYMGITWTLYVYKTKNIKTIRPIPNVLYNGNISRGVLKVIVKTRACAP